MTAAGATPSAPRERSEPPPSPPRSSPPGLRVRSHRRRRSCAATVLPVFLASLALTWNGFVMRSMADRKRRSAGEDGPFLNARAKAAEAPLSRSLASQSQGGPAASAAVASARNVGWLNRRDFGADDAYSGSWYMSREAFAAVDLSRVQSLEAASFAAFRDRWSSVRMTVDWLDWSVEHLSKWWKVLGCPKDDAAHRAATHLLRAYAARERRGWEGEGRDGVPSDSPFPPTVAVVAFAQYRAKPRHYTDRDHQVTVASLAATLTSLVRVGMGRIVVVGHRPNDGRIVRDAVEVMLHGGDGATAAATAPDEEEVVVDAWANAETVRVRASDVAYVRADPVAVVTRNDAVNVPRGALVGLERAWNGANPEWTHRWLGPHPNAWKYVYFTEADLVLQSRPSAWPQLRDALDQGRILAPHRLQPVPYEGDAPGVAPDIHLIPTAFKTPIWLNSGGGTGDSGEAANQPGVDHCCDEQIPRFRPGATRPEGEDCGHVWWTCGYYKGGGNHSRLEPYDLIRLRRGTGIAALAGSAHGRRCIPSRHPCRYNPEHTAETAPGAAETQ